MTATIHDFERSLARGQEGEAFLDRYFAEWFDMTPATHHEQRQGIDRHFQHRGTGRRYDVEYKTDFRAHRTGNGVVETESVDTQGKAGWAYTSRAAILLYYCPGSNANVIYVLPVRRLRKNLPAWQGRYPNFAAENDGYTTRGILVPLSEFERIALQVLDAPTSQEAVSA